MNFRSSTKWILFVALLGFHGLLTWLAFRFDWLILELLAIGPVVLLERFHINLSSCYQFICVPSASGWTVCLLVWGAVHFLIASLLDRLLHENAYTKP